MNGLPTNPVYASGLASAAASTQVAKREQARKLAQREPAPETAKPAPTDEEVKGAEKPPELSSDLPREDAADKVQRHVDVRA
ncbi:MAG: hypothetical protein AAGI46_15440 [Planctomycetota bacterium]